MMEEFDEKTERVAKALTPVAIIGIVAMIILWAVTSCCPKHFPPAEHTDSVRVEIRERIVHDTVSFEVPVIVEKNVTRDSSSHLENDWATSDAAIQGGFLWHSLSTKPHEVDVPVTVTVRDTTYIEKEAETIIKEVPRQPTFWEKTWETLGKVFAGVLLAGLILLLIKIFGK